MSRERLLISTLLELADTMVVEHDVVDFLHLLCERTLQVVDADAAGVLVMTDDGRFEVAAASGPDMRQLEQLEATNRQGPCTDAHRTALRVDVADLEASGQEWPEFAARALPLGFRAVHARPLRWRGQPIGALNVLRKIPGAFDEDESAVIAGLADMASIGIVHERTISAAEKQIGNLQQALEKRAVIDQAVAVMADRLDVDHGEAFAALRRYARDRNLRLRDVARSFLDGEIEAGSIESG